MPNALYDKARKSFLNGEINWTSDEIRVALVTPAYTPDLANHQYLSQITDSNNNSAILQRSTELESKTSDAGVADSADVTFSSATNNAVPAGVVKGIVIYQTGTTDSTSKLIAYLDQINGLPITTTSEQTNLTVHWDNGSNKIFKL